MDDDDNDDGKGKISNTRQQSTHIKKVSFVRQASTF